MCLSLDEEIVALTSRNRTFGGAGSVGESVKVLQLQPTATGTKLVHIERFSGMMLPLMKGMMNEGVPPILNTMNKDLKSPIEGK